MASARDEIVERIEREGPIGFDAFVELALYGEGGFFTRARGAGRAGRDFVTSPEVGTLFGTLVARALDGWWRDAGTPDPFLVIEAGAGRGRLARDVLAAGPDVRDARCVTCWSSAHRSCALAQRDLLTVEPFEDALGPMVRDDEDAPVPVTGMGPIVTALDDLPAVGARRRGVRQRAARQPAVPGRRATRGDAGGRCGSRSTATLSSRASCRRRASSRPRPTWSSPMHPTARASRCRPRSCEWLRACAVALRRGRLVVVDYVATGAELVERGDDGWLRTYRDHARGAPPLVAPGEQDITIDVPARVPRARRGAGRLSDSSATSRQAEWLAELGIDDARRRGPRAVGRPRPRRRPRGRPAPQPRRPRRRARRSLRPRRPPRARLPSLTACPSLAALAPSSSGSEQRWNGA